MITDQILIQQKEFKTHFGEQLMISTDQLIIGDHRFKIDQGTLNETKF